MCLTNFVASSQRLHSDDTPLDGPNQLIVREMNANGIAELAHCRGAGPHVRAVQGRRSGQD
ncbi:unnamed protein product [Gemmata massiliana]|uniref:Uncharacterized protein n=1 Tax=Gemmata massiliana TaxID=1210884 RepID=A0A6P2DGD1_9BACT|nr:unnamed protein product [Gemmata massiliana]